MINIAEEIGGDDAALARRRVRGIGDTLREIYDRADRHGATPLRAAMELASARLAATGGDQPTP